MDSYKLLKLPEIRLFCKNAKIKIGKSTKFELFTKYNQFLATKIIQKEYRKHFYRDAECSITLEKVKYPCFVYRTKFGKLFFYDYQTIVKYISKTGNTHDPMTREQYSDSLLNRLDHSIKKFYPDIKVSSTLKIKRNMGYARKVRDRENEILSYQTLLDELKEKVMYLIDSGLLSMGINEHLTVNNETYLNAEDYILKLLDKINVIYDLLKELDHFWAETYRNDFLESLKTYQITKPEIKNINDFIISL
jgi:hypothetical protein